MRGIDASQHYTTRIPLRQSAIQTIEETGDVYRAPCAIGIGWDSQIESQCDRAEFSGRGYLAGIARTVEGLIV